MWRQLVKGGRTLVKDTIGGRKTRRESEFALVLRKQAMLCHVLSADILSSPTGAAYKTGPTCQLTCKEGLKGK